MVSMALLLRNRPADRVVNANTDNTATKAINAMAVSKLVMTFWSGS